jgi:hypothetical protein
MTQTLPRVTISDMVQSDRVTEIVLQEFRLLTADTSGEAARIVAARSGGLEGAIPLLTSIDDQRDVATVRGLRASEAAADPVQHEELDALVASWGPVRHYAPRIAERSESPPSTYRLAVTESGINNDGSDPSDRSSRGPDVAGAADALGLLWVGLPHGTYAGLMILLGGYGERRAVAAAREWPLDLSRQLGVRIYEGQVGQALPTEGQSL